ncbi:hypothetical protein LCGC14_1827710 [marine sediment metagenome]|uniref:Uncharacterized protein n=1 Tax=marine sediment metagenome TaxID=412755 RepID=A0A0F9IWK1_9ZZZZ
MKLSHPDMGQTKQPVVQNSPRSQTYVVDDQTTPTEPYNPPTPTIDDRLAQFETPAEEPTVTEYPLPPKKSISKTLEKLIFIGKTTEEVEIDGIKFELSTLTNKEHGEIVKAMYRFSEAADLFTVRVLTLANALKKIDGLSIEDIEIEGDFEDNFHKRMSIIDYLQLSVVEELFDKYEGLIKEEDEASEEDKEIKNS